MATAQQTTATSSDPLLEQSNLNKINEDAPISSGSHPPVQVEDGSTQHETNTFEKKLDEAFAVHEHDKELTGAGVGAHPKQ